MMMALEGEVSSAGTQRGRDVADKDNAPISALFTAAGKSSVVFAAVS